MHHLMNNSAHPYGFQRTQATTIVYTLLIGAGLLVNFYIVIIYLKTKARESFAKFLLQMSLLNIGQYLGVLPHLLVDPANFCMENNKYVKSVLCGVTDGHGSMLVFSLASCILLAFISLTRCMAVYRPMYRRLSERAINLIFAAIWFLGCVAFIPYLLSYELTHQDHVCVRKWIFPDPFGAIYMISLYCIGLLLPLVTMTFTCVLSYLTLIKNARKHLATALPKENRREIVIILCSLVAIFVFTWFPYSVYWLLTITIFYRKGAENEFQRLEVLDVILIFSLLGNLISPVIYAYKWRAFSVRAKKMLIRLKTCGYKRCNKSLPITTVAMKGKTYQTYQQTPTCDSSPI